MLTVKIVGTEDRKFKALVNRVKEAIVLLEAEVMVEEVTELEAIIDSGIIQTPAIIIQSQVLSQGFLPNMNEIKTLLKVFLNSNKKKYKETSITKSSKFKVNENPFGANGLFYNSQRRI
jgi:hypothetical protein